MLPLGPSPMRDTLLRLAAAGGVALRVVWEVRNLEAQIQAAISGIGITPTMMDVVASRVEAGQVALLNVEGFPFRFDLKWCAGRNRCRRPPKHYGHTWWTRQPSHRNNDRGRVRRPRSSSRRSVRQPWGRRCGRHGGAGESLDRSGETAYDALHGGTTH